MASLSKPGLEKVEVRVEQDWEYSVYIGASVLDRLGELVANATSAERVTIITNPNVWELFGSVISGSLENSGLRTNLLTVPEGEHQKSLASAEHLYDRLVDKGVLRNEPILALGGGVVGDLAGFVAATYMRGLPFIQVPTSLVAQVDSSIGGKVAVNHPRGKNYIGAFHQPLLVFIDVQTLTTLPEEEFRAGLAEVIKTGFLDGEEFLAYLEGNLEAILAHKEETLVRMVDGCCRFKARVVMEDEREEGLRAILNYGHTIGHALEALTEYGRYRHGEAVAIGMVAAARIARELGLIDEELVQRHMRVLKGAGLPVSLPSISLEGLIEQTARDKKRRGEGRTFAVLKGVGKPEVVEVPLDIIRKGLESGEREGNSVRN